jgi:hypothetical protein
MRESRSSGSVEGVVGNHDPYSDSKKLIPDRSRKHGHARDPRQSADRHFGVGFVPTSRWRERREDNHIYDASALCFDHGDLKAKSNF